MYQKTLYDITEVCKMLSTTSRTLRFYEEKGIDHKEAMKLVAKDRGVSKRDIYQYLVK